MDSRLACVVEGTIESVVQQWDPSVEAEMYVDCYSTQEYEAAEQEVKSQYQVSKKIWHECAGLQAANALAKTEFLEALEEFDSEDEAVDLQELAEAVENLGQNHTDEKLAECIADFDKQGQEGDCTVGLDCRGCLHFRVHFQGCHAGHGNQRCVIDIKVRPFGSV